MKKVHELKSGHKLTVNVATLEEAQNLVNVFAATLATVRLEITQEFIKSMLLGNKEQAMQAMQGQDANFFWNLGLRLLAGRELQDAVFVCAKHCMLNPRGADESIVRSTFEPEVARRDFFPVLLEVMKANLIPFFEDLLSALSSRAKSTESNPQSNA